MDIWRTSCHSSVLVDAVACVFDSQETDESSFLWICGQGLHASQGIVSGGINGKKGSPSAWYLFLSSAYDFTILFVSAAHYHTHFQFTFILLSQLFNTLTIKKKSLMFTPPPSPEPTRTDGFDISTPIHIPSTEPHNLEKFCDSRNSHDTKRRAGRRFLWGNSNTVHRDSIYCVRWISNQSYAKINSNF